jgi:hypothetical protein
LPSTDFPCESFAAYDAEVAQKSDITLAELQAWLASDHAVKVSVGCLWARIRHLGLTLKKSRSAPQSRTASTSRKFVSNGGGSGMAIAQSGLCQRNRRIYQNDAAPRPMPARQAEVPPERQSTATWARLAQPTNPGDQGHARRAKPSLWARETACARFSIPSL